MTGIRNYKELVCEKLIEYGANEQYLWLVECSSVESFIRIFGEALACDLGLMKYKYVVYFHESGTIHTHGGFNDMNEFEDECRKIGSYLNKPY